MAISAEEREELHGLAREALGQRGARLLMDGLAAHDLDAMEERLTLRIELARSELQGSFDRQFGELRGDFGALEGKFGELRGEFGELRGEFGELRADLASQRVLLFFALLSTILGILGMLYTAFQAGAQ
jgi:hypothetical protein